MSWVADLIPNGRRNRPGIKISPRYITMHDTGNAAVGAGARSHGVFLREHSAPVTPGQIRSWHVTVDDTDVVQHLLFDEMGYHAGHSDGNTSSIGIEICQNPDSDRAVAEDSAAKLVADLMKQYDISIENVVPHSRWADTRCPVLLRTRWHMFIVKVAEYAELTIPEEVDEWRQRAVASQAEADFWKAEANKFKATIDSIKSILEG